MSWPLLFASLYATIALVLAAIIGTPMAILAAQRLPLTKGWRLAVAAILFVAFAFGARLSIEVIRHLVVPFRL